MKYLKLFENFFNEDIGKLYESPDYIKLNDKEIHFLEPNSFAFQIKINKFFNKNKILDVNINPEPGIHGSFKETQKKFGYDYAYPGRIFIDQKILTFWTYPTKEELDIIIPVMERKLNIKIYNNNWLIEVYLDESGNPIEQNNKKIRRSYVNNNKEHIYIPIENYGSSKDIPKEEHEWHTLSPSLKQKKIIQWKEMIKKGIQISSFAKEKIISIEKSKRIPIELKQKMYAESKK